MVWEGQMAQALKGKCQLCGEYALLTDDHLPPKSLYPKAVRSVLIDMHTVKACEKCNNGSKKNDELFKVLVGLVADAPWSDELRESVEATLKNNNRLSRLISENERFEEQLPSYGTPIFVRIVKIPHENRDEFLSVVDRLVKGLFFRKYGEILVEKYQLSLFVPEALHPSKLTEMQSASKSVVWESLNNGTIRFLFIPLKNGDIVIVVNLYGTIELDYVAQRMEGDTDLPGEFVANRYEPRS
jgi:hypothetical protein